LFAQHRQLEWFNAEMHIGLLVARLATVIKSKVQFKVSDFDCN